MALHIVFASPKGGTGRTTLAVQVAASLTSAGLRCVAVDLDPQNAVGLYLGASPASWITSNTGLAGTVGNARHTVGLSQLDLVAATLVENLRARHARVAHLPFGHYDTAQRRLVERELTSDPQRMRNHLAALSPPRCDALLIDTPPGCNAWTDCALEIADMVLVPLVADPATFAVLPAFEGYMRTHFRAIDYAVYVVNRFDPTRRLACDVLDALQGTLPGRVFPSVIHDDEALREQLAHGAPLQLDGSSQFAADLDKLSQFVMRSVRERQPVAEPQAS